MQGSGENKDGDSTMEESKEKWSQRRQKKKKEASPHYECPWLVTRKVEMVGYKYVVEVETPTVHWLGWQGDR